eukprot:gnl/TRDRNA2_/TRDRNA2_30941_c0_seq1.p1 gnl/TRDRNA2_/TRDRNA2_30941_c0~~gnl/TRDRNA2_/TRDRNA2_30941_c0_seq1.p1  ORF type:complete len:328 (-),score=77.99 gnl/TRDRNA2_/TRDRNA2_30941_c0_seq1:101-1084(-)
MGLPIELLQYAENFYRRFPEEFIALGMPGLEEVFDLRTGAVSTSSRRISETPTEKTVEITIRRWQLPGGLPAMPPLGYGPAQPQLAQAPVWNTPAVPSWSTMPLLPPPAADWSVAAQQPSISASTHGFDDQANMRLARLETALAGLKPQLEAVLAGQAMAATAPAPTPQQQIPAPAVRPAAGPAAETSDAAAPTNNAASQDNSRKKAAAAANNNSNTSPTPLLARLRQQSGVSLQIQTTPKTKEDSKPGIFQHAAVIQITDNKDEKAEEKAAVKEVKEIKEISKDKLESKDGDERQRPRVNINAVRVAPSVLDPPSPRSPGRFSAWK